MKGRQTIRLTQWLAIVISTVVTNILTSVYNFFLYQLPTIERMAPSYSFVAELTMNITAGVVTGGLIGLFLVYYMQDRFSDKPYGYTIMVLFVSVFGVLLVLGLAFMIPYVMLLTGKPITDPESKALFRELFFNQVNPALFVIFPLVLLQYLMLQILNKFCPGVFWKMVRGKYYRPKTEDRIFMFLDLNASTTMAEQLGIERYHDLLRDFFADITNSILDHGGEIYQYLGDGIIIAWNTQGDQRDQRCMQCFFEMRHDIQSRQEAYMKKFGLVPSFKAGLHAGHVVVGEIGIIKRDITYSGDVMNTAARIQGMCHELKSELLVSDDFLKSISLPAQLIADAVGSFLLKGKERETGLYRISVN